MNMHRIISQIVIPPEDLDIPQAGTPDKTDVAGLLQIVFGLAGSIAMLVIVIAGIMFILSRGDPQKSAVARNSIIYAAVGLAIMTVAFSIVSFVASSV
jgi:hypothetical protein